MVGDLLSEGADARALRSCVPCCSMSLSSLDSEQDDPFLDQADSAGSTRLLVTGSVGGRRATRGTGAASTHSLNEADLQVSSIIILH
jgi:hypothetical protein